DILPAPAGRSLLLVGFIEARACHQPDGHTPLEGAHSPEHWFGTLFRPIDAIHLPAKAGSFLASTL
ncbi:MAG: hypothetical protein ACTSR0_03495, partial [Candidatus Asgardarchaeia archaeon]